MSEVLGSHRAREQALAALEFGRYALAEQFAREAIANNPEQFQSYAYLVRALHGQKRFADALEPVADGLKRAPESEWLHRLRALSYYHLGRFPEALIAIEEALRLQPLEPLCHYVRSLILEKQKRSKDALTSALRAAELDPEDVGIKRWLGDLHLKNNPAKAEAYYREALMVNPHDASTLNNLGVALQRQNRMREAAKFYKAALLTNPNMSEARENVHNSVRSLVRHGPRWFLILFVTAKLTSRLGIVGFLMGLGIAACIEAVRRYLSRRREDKLRQSDPQLLNIYEKLEADRKAGRL